MPLKPILRLTIKSILFFSAILVSSIYLSGCSAGQKGLLTITPKQYFYSAKERLETIDERNYEVRDLDEIIRVLENAEKDAKSSDIIDKSRLYLILANSLKARKLYQDSVLKGEYVSGRAAPFFIVDTQKVKEALRDAKKWVRACDSEFKSGQHIPDLLFVKGFYYQQKMLTQRGRDKRESLDASIMCFRRCLGMAPEYVSDFRLFRQEQTSREVRLRLIEALALGQQQADAYGLLSEFNFAPISPVAGSTDRQDFAWHHGKGLVLATMGLTDRAAAVLEPFKIIMPQDYPLVDEALWVLEGVYDYQAQETGEPKWEMEARIVAALLDKLSGPYSEVKYSTAAHLFPKLLPGDKIFHEAALSFYHGEFDRALELLLQIHGRGLLSRSNRHASRLMAIEASIYSGQKLTDDLIEELIEIALNNNLLPLQKERAGFLLARYVMNEDSGFITARANHDGQSFIRSVTAKPWAVDLRYKRGQIKRATKPLRHRTEKDEEESEREPSELIAEAYVNRGQDWIVSANLYLIRLPDMTLMGKGRIVGREIEGEGWAFKDDVIDALERRKHYLAVIEYDNSDNEKSIQGILFRL